MYENDYRALLFDCFAAGKQPTPAEPVFLFEENGKKSTLYYIEKSKLANITRPIEERLERFGNNYPIACSKFVNWLRLRKLSHSCFYD
jgi:hypothetical protein